MKQLKTLMFITTLIIPVLASAEKITFEEIDQLIKERSVSEKFYKLHSIVGKMALTVNKAIDVLAEKRPKEIVIILEFKIISEYKNILETNNKLHELTAKYKDKNDDRLVDSITDLIYETSENMRHICFSFNQSHDFREKGLKVSIEAITKKLNEVKIT
jgi:hypothetical protein